MNVTELREHILGGALGEYANLYSDISYQTERFVKALDSFAKIWGEDRQVAILSVPGRSEISGNHTDHNFGRVIAAAIDRDIIAVVSKSDSGIINFHSEGYPDKTVKIEEIKEPENFGKYTQEALIAGVCAGFIKNGYNVGGYDAYATSDVLEGSGISSSAAYEVILGNILNHLYNGGEIENARIAAVGRYAENVFYGKPSGLMDQMACATGGFVYMDFENENEPFIEPISFSLSDFGYSMCIVNTGASHSDLNEDYAAIPGEMKSVAKLLGRDVLRGLSEEDIIKNLSNIRRIVGDRAVLRSLHFLRENERVEEMRQALKSRNLNLFLSGIKASGKSSFEYLQNVYSNKNEREQSIALALALTEGYFKDEEVAMRVHGGGFAGTIQLFAKTEKISGYKEYINNLFGHNAAAEYSVRRCGAVRLF